jgi:hypothetical protein
MPVVIKELHVQVNVEEDRPDIRADRRQGKRSENEALIRECVEKAVEIMKREEQR